MAKKLITIVIALLKLSMKFVPKGKIRILAILSLLGVILSAVAGSLDAGWVDSVVSVIEANDKVPGLENIVSGL